MRLGPPERSLDFVALGTFVSVTAGCVALAGVLGAAAIKLNRKANADIRSSMALDRIAAALERAHPARPQRPSLLDDAPEEP